MNILGISAYYHDSAAALLQDGCITAAAQEERFSRKKHDARFPRKAVQFCLEYANIAPTDINLLVFYEKPLLKFKRIMSTYLEFSPKGFTSFQKAMPLWFGKKLFQKRHICQEMRSLNPDIDWSERLIFSEHHLSHAASAFFPSPFNESAVLTLDGVGEWATSSIMLGKGNELSPLYEINFPHSLGLFYSAFTYYLGFKVNSGEYKVMGLAPYGTPRFSKQILNEMIDVKQDGSYCLNLKYFNYCTGLTMVDKTFEHFFGAPRRLPENTITQFHMDVAASVQDVLEYVVLRITKNIAHETKQKTLCMAGGVALNCVTNGKIIKEGIFDNVWIQPASGDAGGALGAALAGHYLYAKNKRVVKKGVDAMQGAYLGPAFTSDQTKLALDKLGAVYHTLPEQTLIEVTALNLVNHKCIGWFQGRMEFGPRALGCRSIIADPRDPEMQKTLNLKIKFRESFRPFAPSILADHVEEWFEVNVNSPYMLLVSNIKDNKCDQARANKQVGSFGFEKLTSIRSKIPAVTHVDYSARIQTVHADINPRYYKLIEKFYEKTNCPALINTSFNIRGEPIVRSPEDAFRCFMGTKLDVLVINNYILYKTEQDNRLLIDYRKRFALD